MRNCDCQHNNQCLANWICKYKNSKQKCWFFQNQYFISLPIKLFCFLKDVTKWFNSSLSRKYLPNVWLTNNQKITNSEQKMLFTILWFILFYLKEYLNKSWNVIGSINKENKVNQKSHKDIQINIIWNITQRMRNVWDSFLAKKKQRIFWPWKCFLFVFFAL